MKEDKNRLKLPHNYFERLSKNILEKIRKNQVYEELCSISSFVAQHLKKENLFKVPQNYFQKLPEQIIYQTQPLRIRSVKQEFLFAISAASILFVFVLSIYLSQPKNTTQTTQINDNMILTALIIEQDETSLETEAIKNKEVLLAVAETIEQQNTLQKSVLEQEIDLDKNFENELEKALENELDNL